MKLQELMASLSVKAITLTVVCVSLSLLAVLSLATADTIFTGVGCPGLGFVAGVVTRGPDVDAEDICNFLEQGGGLSGPGFGLGTGGWPSRREEACIEAGGAWDGHRCHMEEPKPPNPDPRTLKPALPPRPTMLYGLPITFKGQRMLVLVKPSYVKDKNKLLPILLAGKSDGTSKLPKSKREINR